MQKRNLKAHKYVFVKKSTISTQSLWNKGKMFNPWGDIWNQFLDQNLNMKISMSLNAIWFMRNLVNICTVSQVFGFFVQLFLIFSDEFWLVVPYLIFYLVIFTFYIFIVKLRCQYWRYWTLGRRPQASRRRCSCICTI